MKEAQPETPGAFKIHKKPEQGRWLIRKVRLIEGGYPSDTRHLEKLVEKQTQHRKLVGALELRGSTVQPMVFTFGVGGTAYNLWRT